MTEPQPGEAWVVTERQYGPDRYDVIPLANTPFIVVRITVDSINVIYAGPNDASTYNYQRGKWDWDKHATRIWPPAPTWENLRDEERIPDDLRARAPEDVA